MNIFNRKWSKNDPQKGEKKDGQPAKKDEKGMAEPKLDTAAVANTKKRFAQELYEPWMDQRTPVDVGEKTEQPKSGPRGRYAFSDAYLRSVSATPDPGTTDGDVPLPDHKTPLPTIDEASALEKEKKKDMRKGRATTGGSTRSVGAGSSLILPRASSSLFDLNQQEESAELAEFYAWVTNGREDDIRPETIENLLFRDRRVDARKKKNAKVPA